MWKNIKLNYYNTYEDRLERCNIIDKKVLEDKIKIEDLIYEIRGKQVMLDSDLARLYECTNGTKDINKAVRRNINRFPENFMFQLTDEEYNDLRWQKI